MFFVHIQFIIKKYNNFIEKLIEGTDKIKKPTKIIITVVVIIGVITAIGGFIVKSKVDELDIDKVKVNQSVEMQLDAFPDEVFYGTVTGVSPQGTVVNGVSNFMINVSLPDSIKEIAVIGKDGDIRQGRSDDYMNVAKVDKGDTVEILDKDGDYYKVATKGSEQGWIEESYITDKKIKLSQIGTINKDVVNVKEDPSNDSGTVVKLINGDSVKILEENDV